MSNFYMPPLSLMGEGCLKEVPTEIIKNGFKKALIVTDEVLQNTGLVDELTKVLDESNLEYAIYNGVQPNPTVGNINDGLAILKDNDCDYVISFGGGSPHDAAKGIALVAANGGDIRDYEGLNLSKKPQMPLIAINTTAGTASEMTIFSIITDETRHIKMAIVDSNFLPIIAVNDPALMTSMPAGLTAATGMDALTHAVEAYVSTAATPVTDACAVKTVRIVFEHLRQAVADGSDMEAREQMAYGEYLAGMAFSNASLGYVHAMAHQLGGAYNLPHGTCNAILLPKVCEFNLRSSEGRFAELAKEIGLEGETTADLARNFIDEIIKLANDIEIPAGLSTFDVFNEADIPELTKNALADPCGLTNPVQATPEEISAIFKSAM